MKNNQTIPTPVLIKDLGMMYPTETSNKKSHYGIFKCSCGIEFKAIFGNVKHKVTNSCGCYKTINSSTHGLSGHRLYETWANIMSRCNNKNHPLYEYYGERGITICERWLDISSFIEDMYPSYQEGLSIDRINNNMGYSKENCRWATKSVQQRNTRVICSSNSSGYRGVHFEKSRDKWIAKIMVNNNSKHIGRFSTSLDAAIAYDSYVIENKLEHTINGVIK